MTNENRITFRKIILKKSHSKTRKVWQLYVNNKRMSQTYIYETRVYNATEFIGTGRYEGVFHGYHLNIFHPNLMRAKHYLVEYINNVHYQGP